MSEAVVCVFTVFFEDPFWVGVSERVCGGRLETARVVFGAEPTGPEILDFLANRWTDLRYSPPVELDGGLAPVATNPKRALRLARRQMRDSPTIGTKSQQALQTQRDELAAERKQSNRFERQEADRLRFLEKQEKKKQKKRGH